MDAILHIGTEKTGTTTIQDFLVRNRAALAAQQRLAIPVSCGTGNCRDLAAYAIRDDYPYDDHLRDLGVSGIAAKQVYKRQVEARLEAEVAQLSASCDRALISSEHLQSRLASADELATLRGLLESSGLRVTLIIVYLREQAQLYQSLYSTALRVGRDWSMPREPDNPHWNFIGDHRATIERWTAAFPDARLVPRVFEYAAFTGGGLVSDFCATTGIARAGLLEPVDHNPGLSQLGQRLLRRVNKLAPWLLRPSHRASRARVVGLIDRWFQARSAAPSIVLRQSCKEKFRDSNEWVRQRYFPDRPALFEDHGP